MEQVSDAPNATIPLPTSDGLLATHYNTAGTKSMSSVPPTQATANDYADPPQHSNLLATNMSADRASQSITAGRLKV